MGAWGVFLVQLALFGVTVAQGLEPRRTAIVCKVDKNCPDNAFCQSKAYCVCKDGFVYAAINSTQECLKVVKSGEACVQHIQCHATMGVHSECANKVCACATTSHLKGDRCYETAVIGERCETEMNCFLGNQGPERQALCVQGYCSCLQQYNPRDNGTRCVRDAGLGEVCEDQQQCAGPGLQCRETCRCKNNWVVNNDTKTCVKSVKALNESCSYDVQCDSLAGAGDAKSPGAALCIGGQCLCAYSARAAGNPARCWHKKQLGQECRRDEECILEEFEPAYCLSGRCTCKTCSPDASVIKQVASGAGVSALSNTPVIVTAIFFILKSIRRMNATQLCIC